MREAPRRDIARTLDEPVRWCRPRYFATKPPGPWSSRWAAGHPIRKSRIQKGATSLPFCAPKCKSWRCKLRSADGGAAGVGSRARGVYAYNARLVGEVHVLAGRAHCDGRGGDGVRLVAGTRREHEGVTALD